MFVLSGNYPPQVDPAGDDRPALLLVEALQAQARRDARAGRADAIAWLDWLAAGSDAPLPPELAVLDEQPAEPVEVLPALSLAPLPAVLRLAWVRPVLAATREGQSVAQAARAAGVTHTAVIQLARRDPNFARELAEARHVGELARRSRWPTWAPAVLELVAEGLPMYRAAASAGISAAAVHALARRCERFARALDVARDRLAAAEYSVGVV